MQEKNFGKTDIKINVGQMCTAPKQDPDNPCYLSETVLLAFKKSVYRGYKPHIPERWRGVGILEAFQG